jgi:hypothetical protein
MRLRHIEIFQAIRQTGSVSAAAQLLHVSQPAVTKVLQHAELQLGFPLFLRVRGKLQPRRKPWRWSAKSRKSAKACKACDAWPRACAASRAKRADRRDPGVGAVAAAAGDSGVEHDTRTSPASCPATIAASWCRNC